MKHHIIAIVVCGLLLASCKSHPEEEKKDEKPVKPVVEVALAKAAIADLTLAVHAPATIFPREQANIAARITARIVKLNARKGDRVAAGQPLAVLENRDLVAQREEARAAILDAEATLQKVKGGTLPSDLERARGEVAMTQAALAEKEKVYERRKDLFDKGAIPQRDLLVSETELAQARTAAEVARKARELLEKQSGERDIQIAQSRIAQAQARLDAVNAQLEFTTIHSPFDGVITEQMMYPGDMAKPDGPIFTVMNLSVAIARAQTPAADARAIRQGMACSFMPSDQKEGQGDAFNGRITTINQAVDPQRRTVEIWCEIPNGTRRLKGSEFGTVSITTGNVRHAVVVPVAAVQFAEEEHKGTVAIVDAKNIAHIKEVETGAVTDGKVQIVSGLKGDETVIVEGGYSLPDGTQVHEKEKEKEKAEKDGKDKDEKDEKGEKGKQDNKDDKDEKADKDDKGGKGKEEKKK